MSSYQLATRYHLPAILVGGLNCRNDQKNNSKKESEKLTKSTTAFDLLPEPVPFFLGVLYPREGESEFGIFE